MSLETEQLRVEDRVVSPRQLSIVAYHYVRDLPRTRFPNIKGLLVDGFARQIEWLKARYEMATLESALQFLAGRYQPERDLCLLTFDDGLKEHYTEVLPILHEARVQGLFFLTTSCMRGWVAPVHKNHFLMASLEFDRYRQAVTDRLRQEFPELGIDIHRAHADAQKTHRFDPPEVAAFKYLLNYQLPVHVRDALMNSLFAEFLGDEAAFAQELYLDWNDAIEMQKADMVLGGHSHRHRALTTLGADERWDDLRTCAELLHGNLRHQALWPFSYPHGDTDELTKQMLQRLEFACGFTIRIGPKQTVHPDLFAIQRIDTTEVGN